MAIKASTIRSLYFYVLSAIGLLMMAFSAGDLINTGLKTWVFPKAEEIYFECPYPRIPRPEKASAAETDAESEEETRLRCEEDRARELENRIRNRQASAVRDFSFILVGLPLFLFHFRIVQKERREEKEA